MHPSPPRSPPYHLCRPVGDALVFEEAAGDVSVEIARNGNGQVAGSTIARLFRDSETVNG